MKTLHFWYDPISPYAYLAFAQLPAALQGVGVDVMVHYQPVLFAALLKVHGQKGPAEIQGKREWTYRQVQWLAHQANIPLVLPEQHPFNPLPLLRLAVCMGNRVGNRVGSEGEGCITTSRWVTQQLFDHVWRSPPNTQGIGAAADDPKRIHQLTQRLADHAQTLGSPWLDLAMPQTTAIKQALQHNSQQALAQGVFGVPHLQIDDKTFWGADALPMLRAYLMGDTWFDSGAWQRLPKAFAR